MVTRVPVLAMVLTITLAVTTPALAGTDTATAKPIPGHPDFAITNKGVLIEGGDVVHGKCSTLLQDSDESRWPYYEDAASACKKAGYSIKGLSTQDRGEPQTPLSKTGGLPVILVPIALLVAGGFLIRKYTAL
jgi:hypothetical protein